MHKWLLHTGVPLHASQSPETVHSSTSGRQQPQDAELCRCIVCVHSALKQRMHAFHQLVLATVLGLAVRHMTCSSTTPCLPATRPLVSHLCVF